MALERLLHEPQGRVLIPCFGDVAFEDLTFLIDRPPQVDHLAAQLHVHLVEMPSPLAKPAHPADPLPAHIGSEHRAEPVPPVAHRFVADVDASLEQQVLDIPKREREADVHHHHQADDLG